MFDFDTDTGEIWLYDTIGPSWAGMIDAGSVRDAMKAIGPKRDITLRVSSAGGSVWDAVDIFNMIERHEGKVIAEVDGLAASAASFLILAADQIRAAKNATFMIHRAWSVTAGDVNEHRRTIEMLEKTDENIVGMYVEATGQETEVVEAAMDAETWFTAQEAMDWGLVDQVIGKRSAPQEIAAGMYRNTPAALVKKVTAGSGTQWFPHRQRAKNFLLVSKA